MDRGSRYCSIDYQAELRRHGTKASTIVKPEAVFQTVGAKAPNCRLALAAGSSGAMTLPPFAQVTASEEVA